MFHRNTNVFSFEIWEIFKNTIGWWLLLEEYLNLNIHQRETNTNHFALLKYSSSSYQFKCTYLGLRSACFRTAFLVSDLLKVKGNYSVAIDLSKLLGCHKNHGMYIYSFMSKHILVQ